MISTLSDVVKCEVCEGVLEFDQQSTLEDYSLVVQADVTNVFEKIEDIIGKYLVYVCSSCGQTYKYTYKDLESKLRKNLTELLFMLIVRGEMLENLSLHDKYIVYCGKCSGYDGSGGCPKTVFDKCEIKRFPVYEL